MKSLDLAKKPQVKRNKVSPQKDISLPKRPPKKSFISIIENRQKKKLMLWILVSGTMIVVIIGWLIFLPRRFSNNQAKEGESFQEIIQEFGKIFKTIDKTLETGVKKLRSSFPSVTNVSNMNEEGFKQYLEQLRIRELEKETFPQFENINLNINK